MFRHRLALALHKSVAEIEATMTMRELIDWRTFDTRHEPLPDRLFDIHLAVVSSLMVNLMRAPDSAAVPATDFFVIRDEPVAVPSQGDEIDKLRRQWRGE